MIQLSLIDWLQTNPQKHISFYEEKEVMELSLVLALERKRKKNPYHIETRLHCKYLMNTYGMPKTGNRHITWNEEEIYRPYPVGKTVSYWTENNDTGYLIQQDYKDIWYVFRYDASKTFLDSCTHIITFSSVEKAKEYCEILLIEGEK